MPRRVEPTEYAAEAELRFVRSSDWVASNTRQRRAASGLTQLELAERAGVSLQYVTQMESPKARPNLTLRALSSVAAALDCEPYHLLSPADSPSQRPVGRPPASAPIAMVAERAEQSYARQPGSGMHAPTRPTHTSGKRR